MALLGLITSEAHAIKISNKFIGTDVEPNLANRLIEDTEGTEVFVK